MNADMVVGGLLAAFGLGALTAYGLGLFLDSLAANIASDLGDCAREGR